LSQAKTFQLIWTLNSTHRMCKFILWIMEKRVWGGSWRSRAVVL